MRALATCLFVVGCGSASAPERATTPVTSPGPAPVADAGIDAPAPAPVPVDELADAPAWTFRYHAPDRLETWTLRYRGDRATVAVETRQATTRYAGSVVDGKTLVLTLASGPNKLSLECKRAKLAVAATCGDKVTKSVDVLDCYHPDFASPMSFGPPPGLEFVITDRCSGYQRPAP